MPVRERQGAAFSDARSCTWLPHEAVHGRRRPPFAGNGGRPASRARDGAPEASGQSDDLRALGGIAAGRARLHSIQALLKDEARALDFGLPTLAPSLETAFLAC